MEQIYFYILLLGALPLIVGLTIAVLYYRYRLDKCMVALCRCISEISDLKQKLIKLNVTYDVYPAEITPREFVRVVRNMLQKLLFLSSFFLVVSSAAAQEKSDTTYLFRFMPEKDMFYVPWSGNDKELARMETCVERFKAAILEGRIPLRVDGYCHSAASEAENLRIAKVRSSRVKSELIIRQKLKEEHFITRNHAAEGDFVTVRITLPKPATQQPTHTATDIAPSATVGTETDATVETAAASEPESTSEPYREAQTVPAPASKSVAAPYTFALRANLLRWATLTPDFGIEWRINRHVGVLVNGSWTSWSWDDKNRRYALWEVNPEVRWYLGREKNGYVGIIYKVGSFNYKFSETGKQGDLMGGGITGGYQLQLNRALSMDFTLGLGYVNADVEKYTITDGVRVRRGKETKHRFGPVQAGVTLVWRFGK